MPRRRHELWGATLREIGILLLVFAPLDVLLSEGLAGPHWGWATVFALCGFVLIIVGIDIEGT